MIEHGNIKCSCAQHKCCQQYYVMCFSQQQHPLLAAVPLQRQAPSIMARSDCAPLQFMQLLPVQNTAASVQPYANIVLPEQTLSSNRETLYKSQTIPKPSSHEELSYIEFGTNEMPSETTNLSAHGHVSPASNTSSTYNVRNAVMATKPCSKQRQEKKQSSKDSHISATRSKSGSARGGRSKDAIIASGASASEEGKNSSLRSLGIQGKQNPPSTYNFLNTVMNCMVL